MPPKRRGRPPGSKNKKSVTEVDEDTDNALAAADKFFEVPIMDMNIEKRQSLNCKVCHKSFLLKKNFVMHNKLEHSELPGSVKCDKCSASCPNKTILKHHIQKCHNKKVFKCDFCDKEFVRRAHVLRHMAQKGCDGKGVTCYPCDICNATFTRNDNLMVHLRVQHIGSKEFNCKMCLYSTNNFCRLVKHYRRHLDQPHHHECDYCGKITSSRAAMAKHMEIHGDKKFACEKCGYTTYTIEVMRRHVLTHVEDKPFKCSVCSSSFIQRSQLQRHLEKHIDYECNKCGQIFTSRGRYMIHQRHHMGLKKLQCPYESCKYANREFTSESSLSNHIDGHKNDKSFSCEVCNKSFTSALRKRRHVATHTLERPRRCMYCVHARAYVRGEQLVRHVRKCHQRVFRDHLAHVRQVLDFGQRSLSGRVSKSEIESILNVLDAESERILNGYCDSAGVLYGGMQEEDPDAGAAELLTVKGEDSPLMSEEELAESLRKLLTQLIDKETLECFGWPDESVDVVLEKVIEQCGAKAADRERWTRVQRLRENTKHLFLYVIEDKNIARILDTHTIDQIVKHILNKVTDDTDTKENSVTKSLKLETELTTRHVTYISSAPSIN